MLVKNVLCEEPKFKLYLETTKEKDPMGGYSSIPPKVLLVNYIRSFYHSIIQKLGRFEMNKVYNALCDNGILKHGHRYL